MIGRHGGRNKVAKVANLLLREGDVEALAQSIMELMSSYELRGRLGRSAAARALNTLDLKVKTIELEAIYDPLLLKH